MLPAEKPMPSMPDPSAPRAQRAPAASALQSTAAVAGAATSPAPATDGATALVDKLRALARREQRVTAGCVADAMGTRGYGPFLLVPALLELSPLGGVPGVPMLLAGVVALFAAQMLFGRQQVWMPQWLRRRAVAGGRLSTALDRLQPVTRFLDRHCHRRLSMLTRGPFVRIAAAAVIALACLAPPLELVPFASSVPMLAIALFGLALLVRDGVLMLAAALGSGAAVVAVIRIVG